MKRAGLEAYIGGLLLVATAQGQSETHTNLQSVNGSGVSVWAGSHPFTLRGVIVNDPEELLDFTWDPGAETGNRMGAEWQMFIQAAAVGDTGGTACWIGQNYSSLGPWVPAGNAYAAAQWSNELYRLNYDTNTLRRFRKGDLVEVRANKSLFYGGKRNINESHRVAPASDFTVTLVQADHGLPAPVVLRLSDFVTVDDGNPGTREDIFDPTRQAGGERYQGLRVRLESLRLATNSFAASGWGKTSWGERRCTVTDGAGRFFTLRMPLTDLGPAPTDWFSAVGILNQESGSGSDGTYGYELFVQKIGPTLRLARNGANMLVFWSAAFTNCTLEYATSLTATAAWQRVESVPARVLAIEEVPAATGSPARFYRLVEQE